MTTHRNQVVLITGANGGLGNAVTRAFLDAGATVFGVSREITAGDFGDHPSFRAQAATIRTPAEAAALVDAVDAAAGRIDALVHLVGGFAGGDRVEETTHETAARMMDLNYHVAFHLLRAILPGMRKRRRGAIVAIGSLAAEEHPAHLAAYAASKAALATLIRCTAREGRDSGITANVVAPGTMDTPANRIANPEADPSRWVQPDQVASLLLHLTSAAGSQVSGAVIPVHSGEL